jgi:hypothetical protein
MIALTTVFTTATPCYRPDRAYCTHSPRDRQNVRHQQTIDDTKSRSNDVPRVNLRTPPVDYELRPPV